MPTTSELAAWSGCHGAVALMATPASRRLPTAGRCQTDAGWHARARPVARHRWTEDSVLGLETWFGTVSGDQIQWESLSSPSPLTQAAAGGTEEAA